MLCDVMSHRNLWQKEAPAAPCSMKWLPLPVWALLVSWPTCAQDDSCKGLCGQRLKVADNEGSLRMFGRLDIPSGMWPWVVSIQLPQREGFKHWCTGSLINSRWVLTAAHCFVLKRYIKVTNWRVLLGVIDLTQPGPNTQVRSIKNLVEHEKFNPINYNYDIALVELGQPVNCNAFVQPACLLDSRMRLPMESRCYFSGWGKGFKGHRESIYAWGHLETHKTLQDVKVFLRSGSACNYTLSYRGRLKDYNLCALAFKGGLDCQGDGGGPLMCKLGSSDLYWVVGVQSWGSGCELGAYAVFVTTQPFLSWIQRKIKETPQLGGPSQPKPSLQLIPNWFPSWTIPPSLPKPTIYRYTRRQFYFDRPNYIPPKKVYTLKPPIQYSTQRFPNVTTTYRPPKRKPGPWSWSWWWPQNQGQNRPRP